MPDEKFITRGSEGKYQLVFVLCFQCVTGNSDYQATINRRFSKFASGAGAGRQYY
jgi:hypothetical protein